VYCLVKGLNTTERLILEGLGNVSPKDLPKTRDLESLTG
jgi:hypothetical protein